MSAPQTLMDRLYIDAIQKKYPEAKINTGGKWYRNCFCEAALAGQPDLQSMSEFNVVGGVLYYNHVDDMT
jgi:hypothetical protein